MVDEELARRFEADRAHLRGVAYRMLGSAGEADDAVQEAWLRLSRNGPDGIANLTGWLTTVTARVCLDMLRSRAARREEPLGDAGFAAGHDPEDEAVLADSVGLALLVVLETLSPAERLAFVLHDMFAVPFSDVAAVVGRSPEAARQLASRARRRVHGTADPDAAADPDLARRREVAAAFLDASRGGDFAALLAVLDPDVVLHVDGALTPTGQPVTVRGAEQVVRRATAFRERAAWARLALVNGRPGLVAAPGGRLGGVMEFTVEGGLITAIDLVADPDRLREVRLAVLD